MSFVAGNDNIQTLLRFRSSEPIAIVIKTLSLEILRLPQPENPGNIGIWIGEIRFRVSFVLGFNGGGRRRVHLRYDLFVLEHNLICDFIFRCRAFHHFLVEFGLGVVTALVLEGESARIGHNTDDDDVAEDENEEMFTDNAGELTEVITGDFDGERETSKDPEEK